MDPNHFFYIFISVVGVLGIICIIDRPIKLTILQFIGLAVIFTAILYPIIPSNGYSGDVQSKPVTAPESAFIALSQCEFVDDSNEPGSTTDVTIGNWIDIFGNYHAKSIRFWVINDTNWSPSEHITYQLNGQYQTLSGTVVAERSCHSKSKFVISIYIDNEPVYNSTVITANESYDFTYDISGANEIRIVCSTTTPYSGYCIVDANVH